MEYSCADGFIDEVSWWLNAFLPTGSILVLKVTWGGGHQILAQLSIAGADFCTISWSLRRSLLQWLKDDQQRLVDRRLVTSVYGQGAYVISRVSNRCFKLWYSCMCYINNPEHSSGSKMLPLVAYLVSWVSSHDWLMGVHLGSCIVVPGAELSLGLDHTAPMSKTLILG